MTDTPNKQHQHPFDAAYLRSRGFSDEACAFFDAHLADDPTTAHMLARLSLIADELADAGADSAIPAAMFLGALDECDVKTSAELPFELDEATREVIDGSQSSPAMEANCQSPATRRAAAVLNTLGRVCDQKTSYAWADETLHQSPLKTYAQVSLSVVDDQLARIALALDHELRFLPRLDTKQALDSDKEHQVVMVATLVIFWVEDDQVHCGMSERYGARWADVARFARREGFPVHKGFQGEVLTDERIDEIFELIEKRQRV